MYDILTMVFFQDGYITFWKKIDEKTYNKMILNLLPIDRNHAGSNIEPDVIEKQVRKLFKLIFDNEDEILELLDFIDCVHADLDKYFFKFIGSYIPMKNEKTSKLHFAFKIHGGYLSVTIIKR